jgi:ATP-binding cassette subfamily B (MDR/TAP) protein 1
MIAVMEQMTEVNESSDDTYFVTTNEFKGKIEFEGVVFKYPTAPEKTILNAFSEVFESNKTTAIYGVKSGKSTIIHLIERNYDPTHGRILVDGKDIQDIEINSLRQKIGYVSEDPFLFEQTVRDNMRQAAPNATDAEIEE